MPPIKNGTMKKAITISTGMVDPDLINSVEVDISVPYSVSKAALNVAVAKYNTRYKRDGILFIAISPGLVSTESNARSGNQSHPLPLTDHRPAPPDSMLLARLTEYAPHFTESITPEKSVKAVI
jgi:NAD(P)-dependent dehydrogenase (short-subunit alcohol dehydrogenase family)